MSLPYFPMYPTDFEAKTSHLTLEEDGAYNRLLRICWMTPGCSMPNDEAWIMRRARAMTPAEQQAVRTVLAEFFTVSEGRYSNARLVKEWLAANDAHERRKNAGTKGAKVKALKTKETGPSNAKAMLKQPEPEPEPEPKRRDTNVSLSLSVFEKWWDICPRKIGRGAARKAFDKALKTTDEATLFFAMRSHAEAMADKDTQYIPHPSTWLNQERWTDEHEAKGADFYRNFDAMLKGTDNGLQLTDARNSGEGKSLSSPELQTARAHGQRSEGGADQADSGNDKQAYICAIKPRRFGGSR